MMGVGGLFFVLLPVLQAQERSLQRASQLGADQAVQAEPQRRVALVIGNGDYENATRLLGPRHDADAVADTLRELGFEVIVKRDASSQELQRALADFQDLLDDADVALFYYSGHGLQVDGQNYLVPVDADIPGPEYIRAEALPVDEVLRAMDVGQAQTNIIILDACRNNPFAKSWVSKSKAVPPPGLATVTAASGFYIAYATAPGDVALDGGDAVGPYASALTRAMGVPGLELNHVFQMVGKEVQTQTEGGQVPWAASSLVDRFCFDPTAAACGFVEAPVLPVDEPTWLDDLDLDLVLALGAGAAFGDELRASVSGEDLLEPAFKLTVPLELGLEGEHDIRFTRAWARLGLGAAPLVGGTFLYAGDGNAAQVPLSFGGHLSGGTMGERVGWGALVGASWPSRLLARGVLRVGGAAGTELRAGVNITTDGTVEPALELLVTEQFRLRGDPLRTKNARESDSEH